MKRDPVLDYAKGIVIILMVIGHCYSKENIVLKLIYGFHMPFFFMVSGIIYGRKSNNVNFQFSVVKTMKNLLIPYFVYDSLLVVFLAILDPSRNFWESLYARGLSTITFRGVGATWYLACTVIVEILFFTIWKIKKEWIYYSSAAIFFAGFLLAPYVSGIPVVLVRGLIGIGFFAVGFYAGQSGLSEIPCQKSLLVCIAGAIVYVICTLNNGKISLAHLDFSNPILYVCNSIIGSLTLLLFVQILHKRYSGKLILNILEKLGKNTLFILGTHMLLVEIIRLLDYKLFGDLLKKLGIAEGIVFGLIVCVAEYTMIPIYQHIKSGLNQKYKEC